MNASLTEIECSRRSKLEKEVLNHTHAAGKALISIRDERLYRDTHNTFEEYAEEIFGYSSRHLNRIIEFSKLKIGPIGSEIKNERQARAISDVPPERREEVMDAVQKNGPVTARTIKEVAAKIIDVPLDSEPDVMRDLTGYPIPENQIEFFTRKDVVTKLIHQVETIRGAVVNAQNGTDKLFIGIDLPSIIIDLGNIHQTLKEAIAFAVCPFCQGHTAPNCRPCKKRGVFSEFEWNTKAPAELKAIRAKVSKL